MTVIRWLLFSTLIGSIMLIFFPEDVPFRRRILKQIAGKRANEKMEKELAIFRGQLAEIMVQLEKRSEQIGDSLRSRVEELVHAMQERLAKLEEAEDLRTTAH